MDLGVVASRLLGFVHNSPIPVSADILAKASLSRLCSGRKAAARRLSRTQDPTKGQLNFFNNSFRPKTGHSECVYCVLRWVYVALRLGGRDAHAHVYGMHPN